MRDCGTAADEANSSGGLQCDGAEAKGIGGAARAGMLRMDGVDACGSESRDDLRL